MKAILMSIQPKWCEKIANGEKTIEVRKTKPKLQTPFKCYIYCTQTKTIGDIILCKSEENAKLFGYNAVKGINKGFSEKEDINLKGKVIGEFVCDKIAGEGETIRGNACLTVDELIDYCKGKDLYFWHITDLKIYDKPKELSEFRIAEYHYGKIHLPPRDISRPPQSWCYIEERGE